MVGLEKMLGLWPLVRQLLETKERLDSLSDGEASRSVLEQYLSQHDTLADEMAK